MFAMLNGILGSRYARPRMTLFLLSYPTTNNVIPDLIGYLIGHGILGSRYARPRMTRKNARPRMTLFLLSYPTRSGISSVMGFSVLATLAQE